MGNCGRKESSTEWGGEDWGLSSPPHKLYGDEELHFGEDKDRFGKPKREIKVKISKKQLAELMGKADVEGLSIHQLLAELMNGGRRCRVYRRSTEFQFVLQIKSFLDLQQPCKEFLCK